MNRKKRTNRGVTLAELCIVMAVIAIVSTMVVSFTVLMQARTRIIAAERDIVSDIGMVETALDTFIRKYDSDTYTLSVKKGEDGTPASLSVKSGSTEIALTLSTDPETEKVNSIEITENGTATSSLPLHTVTKLEFEIVTEDRDDNSASALVICKVTYTRTDKSGNTSETATICHAVRAMKTAG